VPKAPFDLWPKPNIMWKVIGNSQRKAKIEGVIIVLRSWPYTENTLQTVTSHLHTFSTVGLLTKSNSSDNSLLILFRHL